MKRMAYRGISFNEAQTVILSQRYDRKESRNFRNGVAARSLFGPGVYLINDLELAAQYAFCHAEVENEEQAVILKQKINLKHPFILNYKYSERRLRKDALNWKYANEDSLYNKIAQNSLDTCRQIGQDVMEYLLHHSYDSIIYHINDEIIYYVLYDQERQLEDIEIELVFNIHDLLSKTSLQ